MWLVASHFVSACVGNYDRCSSGFLNEQRMYDYAALIVPTRAAAGEIISRKYTQLGQVKSATGIGYLQELARKYPDGAVISNSPFNPRALQGQRLTGDLILEVPAQKVQIPREVTDYASKHGIVIRDVNGVIY